MLLNRPLARICLRVCSWICSSVVVTGGYEVEIISLGCFRHGGCQRTSKAPYVPAIKVKKVLLIRWEIKKKKTDGGKQNIYIYILKFSYF